MNIASTAVAAAIVYALAAGAPGSILGVRVEPGAAAPTGAIGILLEGVGVANLDEAARVALRPDREGLRLDEGRLRLATSAVFLIDAGDLQVQAGPGSEVLVRREGRAVEVCVVTGEARLYGVPRGAEPEPPEGGDGGEDSGGAERIGSGACRRIGEPAGPPPSAESLAERAAVLRRAAEGTLPPPVEPPDLIGDLDEHVDEIESQWSAALEQGPRREASSCGCAEDGGTSGGLDPGGGTGPDPEPEHPDPGTIRVRIGLPDR